MDHSPAPVHVEARLRVIYGDTDQMGVVYYANYLRYFEFSRSEYFRARGGNYVELERTGFGLPVVEAHCEYRAPARYDELLVIRVHVAQLKRASIRFEYQVLRDATGPLLATGYTLHACVGRDGRPTRLPADVVKLLSSPP
ncbi:MAG: acyl-CoA thioesterase [Myxococcales bacterium]|nr:acyl-CoA thioesterase [Myxococcales bacterium]